MKKGILILVVVVVALGIWLFSGYNQLVTLNENADAQWAQVESSYQRRFDLIPNLVNTVKGAFGQEQAVFGEIANARARYSGAGTPDERAAAASEVEGALARLLVIVESYPQLQSMVSVQNLMVDLEGTENRINIERGRYNEIVREYNTTIKQFPRNILAAITGFDERAYFEADQRAATAPSVDFSE